MNKKGFTFHCQYPDPTIPLAMWLKSVGPNLPYLRGFLLILYFLNPLRLLHGIWELDFCLQYNYCGELVFYSIIMFSFGQIFITAWKMYESWVMTIHIAFKSMEISYEFSFSAFMYNITYCWAFLWYQYFCNFVALYCLRSDNQPVTIFGSFCMNHITIYFSMYFCMCVYDINIIDI